MPSAQPPGHQRIEIVDGELRHHHGGHVYALPLASALSMRITGGYDGVRELQVWGSSVFSRVVSPTTIPGFEETVAALAELPGFDRLALEEGRRPGKGEFHLWRRAPAVNAGILDVPPSTVRDELERGYARSFRSSPQGRS